ncbi:hypothetical protein DDQ41_22395 [Streptomyces spongiicola]|uniref:Transposase IS4 N-terminal domain-containing protein n=1 Tax=Streptomyces spongiicola TaxID=1690221 RepID=A0ABM6VBF1_9ACTN|nr:hypothetical protein DDQ41_22395 [Streptomyces spongiicola]
MSLGVLASELPREAVDEVVAAHSKQPRRRGSKLPAHVMVYFALALGLWSGDDYEQVMAQLTDRLGGLGGWEADWQTPTSGGITKVRRRLEPGVLADLYERLAEPVAEILTPGPGPGDGGLRPWTAPWSTCPTPPPTTRTSAGRATPPRRARSHRPGSWHRPRSEGAVTCTPVNTLLQERRPEHPGRRSCGPTAAAGRRPPRLLAGGTAPPGMLRPGRRCVDRDRWGGGPVAARRPPRQRRTPLRSFSRAPIAPLPRARRS